MTLQLYYYYEEEGSSLVSKVNTGGILAQELAAESWDCFPKFLAASLAACQSWYLCLIVITPLRADHYLAACLHFPSHFQKEIIRAVVLRRGLQVQLPAVSGSSTPEHTRIARENKPIAMVIALHPASYFILPGGDLAFLASRTSPNPLSFL